MRLSVTHFQIVFSFINHSLVLIHQKIFPGTEHDSKVAAISCCSRKILMRKNPQNKNKKKKAAARVSCKNFFSFPTPSFLSEFPTKLSRKISMRTF